MPKHPVTLKIEAAIALLERHGMEVTPAAVKVNVEKDLTWADWAPEKAASEALDGRIRRTLKAGGHIISDATMGVRKGFWEAEIPDLEEQLRVKEESNTYDRNRILADRAVLDFLKEKEKDFGYPVYPGLFHMEIDRIYAMHSLTPPGAQEAA
jgi:hypothetical protein